MFERAVDVATQADGKIIVAGTSSVFPGPARVSVARVNANGSFDNSFGTGGAVLTALGLSDSVTDIAIQQDGRIVVAGSTATTGLRDVALVRYHADGSLDLSFDGDGIVTTDLGGQEFATGVALLADGRIVVSATVLADLTLFNFDIAVMRYNADGSPDSSFDGDGVVVTDFGQSDDAGAGVVVQSDGKIVVGGLTNGGSTPQDLLLLRYDTDGSLDPAFGTGGIAVVDFGGTFEVGSSLALQVDDKIVLSGTDRCCPGEASACRSPARPSSACRRRWSSRRRRLTAAIRRCSARCLRG